MNVCRWKGNKRQGRILCDKPIHEVESITTDDAVITCKECLLLTTKFTSKAKHTHLNADFLSFANIGENGLVDFEDYQEIKDGRKRTGIRDAKVICKEDSPHFFIPEHRITNDPKKVSCSHCLKIWGKQDTKRFVLTGIMLETGLPLTKINSKIRHASNDKLSSMLNKMLYGDKV